MSLDISLIEKRPTEVFEANITHNLNRMAEAAGIYRYLWRFEETGLTQAWQLIGVLDQAIQDMKARPEHYRQFDAANGWGKFDDFVPWLERLLTACREHPEASIRTSC